MSAECYCCCPTETFMWLVRKIFYLYTIFALLCYIGIIPGVCDFKEYQIFLYIFFSFLLWASLMEVKVNANSGFLQCLYWLYLFVIITSFLGFFINNQSNFDQSKWEIYDEGYVAISSSDASSSGSSTSTSTTDDSSTTTSDASTSTDTSTTSDTSTTTEEETATTEPEEPVPSWVTDGTTTLTLLEDLNNQIEMYRVKEKLNLDLENQFQAQDIQDQKFKPIIQNKIQFSIDNKNRPQVIKQIQNLQTQSSITPQQSKTIVLQTSSSSTEEDTVYGQFYVDLVLYFYDWFGDYQTAELFVGILWAVWNLIIANGIRVYGDEVTEQLYKQSKSYRVHYN